MPTQKVKERKKFYIGIDIGKQGAISVLDSDGVVTNYATPLIKKEFDMLAFHKILSTYQGEDVHVVFEDLRAIHLVSSASTFSLGGMAYATQMACVCLYLPFTPINPKVWQSEMFTGVKEIRVLKKGNIKDSRDTKAMALVAVKRLFPSVNLCASERAKVPHDGIVDAILMAEYCRRHFK